MTTKNRQKAFGTLVPGDAILLSGQFGGARIIEEITESADGGRVFHCAYGPYNYNQERYQVPASKLHHTRYHKGAKRVPFFSCMRAAIGYDIDCLNKAVGRIEHEIKRKQKELQSARRSIEILKEKRNNL